MYHKVSRQFIQQIWDKLGAKAIRTQGTYGSTEVFTYTYSDDSQSIVTIDKFMHNITISIYGKIDLIARFTTIGI